MASLHERIALFIEQESKTGFYRGVDNLNGQVPDDICQLLESELKLRHTNIYSKSKKDLLIKQIYDIELDWKRNQVKQISNLIGDMPKYSIGSELRSSVDEHNNTSERSHGGISLGHLIEDVIQLPRMAIANEGEGDEEEFMILHEYNTLKDELVSKCKSIRIAEAKFKNIKLDVTSLEVLFDSIRAYCKDNNDIDISTYLNSYHENLISSLKELEYLLEEAVKSSNTSEVKRARIRLIFDELK